MRPLVFSNTITVRTDAQLRAAIEAAAEREETSASDWIRRALQAVTQSAQASRGLSGGPNAAAAHG